MKTVYLLRDETLKSCIRSALYADGKMFQILERPWLGNKPNVSCIPAGAYKCRYMERSPSGKYRNIYVVENVHGRTGILCHNGNLVSHTKGCLLIGKRRGFLSGQPAVLSSRTALGEFVGLMEKQDFELIIIGNQILGAA